MSKSKYFRGSEWRKWDLHIHSPLSILNNQFPKLKNGNPDWKPYLEKLESLDLAVMGITDYFTIEGYKKIQEYKKSGRLQNIQAIFPNVEFRLDSIISSKKDGKEPRRLNYHVIFSDEVDVQDIEEHFLHDITFCYQGNPQDKDEEKKLKVSNIEMLGRRLMGEHEEFRKIGSPLVVGAMNAVVNHKQISELLYGDSRFRGKFFIVFPEELSNLISWDGQDHHIRKSLLQKANLVFSSNQKTRNWCLGRSPYSEGVKGFEKEFKTLKPCIHGSDAHDIDRVGYPCSQTGKDKLHDCSKDPAQCELRFCWIKAEPTFEGLKQIVYEPNFRVKIQTENPADAEVYKRISNLELELPKKLKFKGGGSDSEFCLRDKYGLGFSNNLTCIIGGRGSGKSSLIHILFNKWRRDALDRLKRVDSPLLGLDLGRDPVGDVKNRTVSDVPSDADFFLQNEVEDAAADVDTMSKLVRYRLEKLSSLGDAKKEEYLSSLEESWRSASQDISSLLDSREQVTQTDREIKQIEKEIKELSDQLGVIKSGEYQGGIAAAKETAEKLVKFKTFEQQRGDSVLSLKKMKATIEEFDWVGFGQQGAVEETTKLLDEAVRVMDEAKRKACIGFDENEQLAKLTEQKMAVRRFLSERGISEEDIVTLAGAAEKIAEQQKLIQTYNAVIAPHREIVSQLDGRLSKYSQAFSVYKDRFRAVADELRSRIDGCFVDERGSKISFKFDLNEEYIKQSLVDFLKKKNTTSVQLNAEDLKRVLFENNEVKDYLDEKEKFRKALVGGVAAEAHVHALTELFSSDEFLEELFIRLHQLYFDIGNIQVHIELDNKELGSTSFGERCGIVMAIVLAAGTNPIIIDQPEDNLDGLYVSQVLVPLIRAKKRERQIVLVTRDANIVIGGDAELLQIMEDDGRGRSVIRPATIEDLEARTSYINILEGGKAAFLVREQKYSLKS